MVDDSDGDSNAYNNMYNMTSSHENSSLVNLPLPASSKYDSEDKVVIGSIRHTSDVLAKRTVYRALATMGQYIKKRSQMQREKSFDTVTKFATVDTKGTSSGSKTNTKDKKFSSTRNGDGKVVKVVTRSSTTPIPIPQTPAQNSTQIKETLELKWSIEESIKNEKDQIVANKQSELNSSTNKASTSSSSSASPSIINSEGTSNIQEACSTPCTTCRGKGVTCCQFCNGVGYIDFGMQERGTVGERMVSKQHGKKGVKLGLNAGVECPVCDENGDQVCADCNGSGWIANWRCMKP